MSAETPAGQILELLDAANVELRSVRSELAALKARSCRTCSHFFPIDFGVDGCGAFYGLRPEPDHACNAWTAKEPT